MGSYELSVVKVWFILFFVYILGVGYIIGGHLPIWGVAILSSITVFITYSIGFQNDDEDVIENTISYFSSGALFSLIATIPGLMLFLIYSILGRGLAVLRITRIRRASPANRYNRRSNSFIRYTSWAPYSLLFQDYLVEEQSITSSIVTIFIFDYITAMIAFEAGLFYIIGGGIGGSLYYIFWGLWK